MHGSFLALRLCPAAATLRAHGKSEHKTVNCAPPISAPMALMAAHPEAAAGPLR